VRQVGYLQGLYRDARSTEHKTEIVVVWVTTPCMLVGSCPRFGQPRCFYLDNKIAISLGVHLLNHFL